MPARRSLYHEYPDHRVDLEPTAGRVRASLGGTVIADSTRCLTVRETNHSPVVYFPHDDVAFEYLEATGHGTFCPFKGDASYWTVRAGELVEENAAWSYRDPFDEVSRLENYLAFYSDRIELEMNG